MSTKTTANKATGADSAKSENAKRVVTNKAGKVTVVTNNEIIENAEMHPGDNPTEQIANTTDGPAAATKVKAKKEKKAADAKPATKKPNSIKAISIGNKKIRIAATC